jgi:hypothetical protein
VEGGREKGGGWAWILKAYVLMSLEHELMGEFLREEEK